MKQCILLPNSLFDDGSLECKTWVVATNENSQIVSWKYIQKTFPEHIKAINRAIEEGKHYIGITQEECLPGYFEIQWD